MVVKAGFWVGARLAQGCDTTGTSMDEDTRGLRGLKEVVTGSPGVLVSWEIVGLTSDTGRDTGGKSGPWETGRLLVEGCVISRSSALEFGVIETDSLVICEFPFSRGHELGCFVAPNMASVFPCWNI